MNIAESSKMTILERFNSKIRKTNTCWLWTDHISKSTGYGQFYITDGKRPMAHQASYELYIDSIPKGLQIDHLCRNRACVNPEHLQAVTQQENLLRGDTIPAKNSQKTHCPLGHPYSVENTYRYKNSRQCRTCHRLNELKRYHSKQNFIVRLFKRHGI